MPFSRARACMASTISRDICFLLLDQIRTVDVGVRDGDHACGGGDRHLLVRGADELAREALVAVAPVAGANASAATEEAAEVGRLRERALDAGRGHLERIALTELGELMGDALAQIERDAVGMVDEHAERVATDDLDEQHLDLRLGRGKAALDIRLQAAHPSLLPTTKKRASARFLTCAGDRRPNESCEAEDSTVHLGGAVEEALSQGRVTWRRVAVGECESTANRPVPRASGAGYLRQPPAAASGRGTGGSRPARAAGSPPEPAGGAPRRDGPSAAASGPGRTGR